MPFSIREMYLVPQEKRSLYGMRGLEVYASSHPADASCLYNYPSTSTPYKNVFAFGTTDLEFKIMEVFEIDKLHDNIVSYLQATLPDCDWGLNVLRLGFAPWPLENPITIHIVVAGEALSEDVACRIVSKTRKFISTKDLDLSEMKSIHIDVCRASKSGVDSCSVFHSNPEVYNSNARLPYSSFGPAAKNSVGTLSGYIQHCDENGQTTKYALTCRRVVDPNGSLSKKPYVEESGNPKRQVTCPAARDHQQTIQQLEDEITASGSATDSQNGINTICEIATMEQALKNATQYNIDFGRVYATSGLHRLLAPNRGRSDWAIMLITNPAISAENKYVRTIDSFISFRHPRIGPVDNEFRRDAVKHFNPGPYFKRIRRDRLLAGEVVFKPRSRTTNKWVAGMVSGIRSTQKIKGGGSTSREICIVALNPEVPMYAPGDSGSIIVDRDFRPVAMMWGEDTRHFAMGPKNIAYATPLPRIFRDIETCLGWNKGSVSLALEESQN